MNASQVHMLATYLPLLGLVLSLAILGYSLIKKSKRGNQISLGLLLLSVFCGIFAYQTGAYTKESMQATTNLVDAITRHELYAKITMAYFYAVTLVGIVTLILVVKNKRLAKRMLIVTLIIQVVTIALLLTTISIGKRIRSENAFTQQDTGNSGENEEESMP